MWEIKSDGMLAVNEKTGTTFRVAFCSDGLYRVKKNYKTIGAFDNSFDDKNFLAKKVSELNGEENEKQIS